MEVALRRDVKKSSDVLLKLYNSLMDLFSITEIIAALKCHARTQQCWCVCSLHRLCRGCEAVWVWRSHIPEHVDAPRFAPTRRTTRAATNGLRANRSSEQPNNRSMRRIYPGHNLCRWPPSVSLQSMESRKEKTRPFVPSVRAQRDCFVEP